MDELPAARARRWLVHAQNTTVVFPAPLMSTIAELGSFLATEQAAATAALPPSSDKNKPPTPPSGAARKAS